MKKIFTAIVLCLTAIVAWADEPKPFIESLTGSITGNTLTLTAKMNYDNIQGQIESTVKYHWTKGGAEQQGTNNVFTVQDGAFTPTDIVWDVYATYIYNDEQKETEHVLYTQKKPDVSLSGSVEGFVLTLTPTLNTCGVEVTNVQYYMLDAVSEETGTAFDANQDAVNFDGKTWVVYATYEYNSTTYRSSCGTFVQEPSSSPTLTVVKNEEHDQSRDQLVMTASLSNEYDGKITNIQYHWSKNGGAEQIETTGTITSPHSFATQEWSCYASFEFGGNTYKTNTETYTYYSTLGHITIKITDDGTNLTAELYHADAEGNPTTKLDLPTGTTVTYEWTDSKKIKYVNTTATQTKPTNGAIWIECKATLKDSQSETLEKYEVYRLNAQAEIVVYISSTGSDNNSGLESDKPVKSWKTAYSLLPRGGNWDNNIIVVQGTMPLKITDDMTNGGVPATITGVWPWNSVDGTTIQNGGTLEIKDARREYRIGADTKFKNVCFTSGGAQCHLCLFLHNTTFDTGCIMKDMGTLATNMGAMSTDTHKAPNFHMMLFSDEHDFTTHGVWNQTKPMTLTIKSGRFGRILCTRIAGTSVETQIKKRYVVGKPSQPLMAKIEVDIDPSNDVAGYNPNSYKDDIAFLCAGTTQGTVYADVDMNIRRGKIATVVAGSQGNAIAGCVTANLPTSSYFGRTTINIDERNNNDIKIYRYFAGCLGRFTGATSGECKAYYYGHSTLNLINGTIEQDLFASAGGLSGLRNPNDKYTGENQYTSDVYIPYEGGRNAAYPYLGIDYNKYDADKTVVKVKSNLNGEEEVIDLANTKVIFNIQGGTVNGNVYGGSYGYSSEMNVANSPKGAGSLWGNTEINISGGTIKGSIYGGGGGSTEYYNQETTDKTKFLNVATVYGNTNVTITGTPNIQGNIYGGGAGVDATNEQEFLEIAKVYGNTNVIFNADYTDDNPFKGNIYGGGAKGGVEGNTNVVIKKGVIVGNVFGGSQGQEGYSNKAKVIGTTKVVIGK